MAESNDERINYRRKPELRISGVSPKTHETLCNIADNIGVGISEFLRPELKKIIDSYPEKMKQPKPKH